MGKMSTRTANELNVYTARHGLKPLPKTPVSEWADNYRILSTGAAEPGKWRTARAPYQQEIMDAFTQPGVHRVVVKSCAQVGKALDVETPIPTPSGWQLMGTLAPGDTVFDETGRVCTVTACTDIMYNHPCYEVTFSDGATIVADAEHRWQVQTDTHRGPVNHVMTTAEMIAGYKRNGRNAYAIPVAGALRLGEAELLLDPYTLGAWLGDGNSMSAQITSPDKDLFIAERIRSAGHKVIIRQKDERNQHIKNIVIDPYDHNDPICRHGHDKRITGYTSNGGCAECSRQSAMCSKWKGVKDVHVDPVVHTQKTLRSVLCRLGVLGNKHIPAEYLRASEVQRWELLQGLMDTDGSVSRDGRHCEITFNNRRLIEDTSELLYTLGIKHSVSERQAHCTNSPTKAVSTVWRIAFTSYSDMPIFSLPRKSERVASYEGRRYTETGRRRVVKIEPVDSRPVKCITVDSPSHLYLAGRAMIPTHNSDIMNNVIGRYAHLDPCAIMMIQPTVEMAEDFSKTRIAPMLRDTKVLTDLFSDVKTRDANNTILSKLFPGGRLIMCGANSPAGLASRPIRVLLCDEVDRFPESAGQEGDPVDLASKRMTTFWNYVMGLFSTPTLEGASRIDIAYESGTQEEWQHKCPGCGEYHKLSYLDMEPDASEMGAVQGRKTYLVREVRWRCPDCGHIYSEREIKSAPQCYVAQNPEALATGCRSFYLNAFSSPWITWSAIMKEWLEARGDANREKVVMNTRFGESYRAARAFESENFLAKAAREVWRRAA